MPWAFYFCVNPGHTQIVRVDSNFKTLGFISFLIQGVGEDIIFPPNRADEIRPYRDLQAQNCALHRLGSAKLRMTC